MYLNFKIQQGHMLDSIVKLNHSGSRVALM